MKKQMSKKIIIFFIVFCLLITPTLGFASQGGGSGGGGGEGGVSVVLVVNTLAILTTMVFVIWTTIFLSALLRHSALKSKVFRNQSRNKVSMMPLMGILGLPQILLVALMSYPAALMALSFQKQRKAVANKWSGKINTNPIVSDGQSKGLVNPVKGDAESFTHIHFTPKYKF